MAYIKTLIRRMASGVRQRLRHFLQLPPNYVGDNGCIRAAAAFCAWNQVPGDYLEFGVSHGYSFIAACDAIDGQRANHQRMGFDSAGYRQWTSTPPRFFAFDSFEGMPAGGSERRMVDYAPGAFACSLPQFLANVRNAGVSLARVVTVKGYYSETCTGATKEQHGLTRASVVMVDCDLYESTVPVLDFITNLVQQGTIIVFDDWFRFAGDPNAGEQRACREWLARNPQLELIEFWRQGPQAVAFLVNFRDS